MRIVPTYGHTPGHQSVIVRLPAGEVLLAGDRCYTERNLDAMVLPKVTPDFELSMKTFRQLAALRAKGVYVLFGHDGKQWVSVKENVPFER